jgi:hypothetical protein
MPVDATQARQTIQDSQLNLAAQDPDKQEESQDDWIENKPEGARAQFKMPMKPVVRERMSTPVATQPPIKIHNFIGTSEDQQQLFLFNYHDLHQAPVETAIEGTMKEAMLQALSSVGARLLAEQPIRYRTNPGKAYEFRFARDEKIYKGLARIFLVGNRQYQIAVMMKEDGFDQALADKFLNSLRLIEPQSEPDKAPAAESQADGESNSKPELGGEEPSEKKQLPASDNKDG